MSKVNYQVNQMNKQVVEREKRRLSHLSLPIKINFVGYPLKLGYPFIDYHLVKRYLFIQIP